MCVSILQLKQAKLARQLEASTAAEKAAAERLQELQEELQDVSSTCRGRIRWLEQAAADAARRTQQLYRCLQGTAPLEVRARHTVLGAYTCLALVKNHGVDPWSSSHLMQAGGAEQ
jgi:hypothetical protein